MRELLQLQLPRLLERRGHRIVRRHALREHLLDLRLELRMQLPLLSGLHAEHHRRLHRHAVLRLQQLDLPVVDVLRQPERVRILRGLHV